MNADGTNPKQVTGCGALAAPCGDPAWSPVPGDERITYAMRTSTNFVLVKIIKSDRSSDVAVTSLAFGGEPTPTWSPDGSRLAFTGAGDTALERALYAIQAVENAGPATRLTSLGADEHAPSWKK
jgi:Tol biopolymer transport system component